MEVTAKPELMLSVEEQTLDVIRGLLIELGSYRAAESLSLRSSFDKDLGLGSLERVELLVRCEARFNTRLPDEVAQSGETPADWVKALRNGEPQVEAAPRTATRYRIQQPARDAPPAPESATTWVEVLRRQAERVPDRVHIHLADPEFSQDITYGQLLERGSEVAAGLRGRGLARDESVAIMLPTCPEFFYAFFGVMLAGGIAVPIYPPSRPDKIEEYVRRQVAILRNAGVRFLIGFDQVKAISKIMRVSIPSLIDMTTVDSLREIGRSAGIRNSPLLVQASQTAFIQYTSGSTGDPKGVVLSQSNVLANVRSIGWAIDFRPSDYVVSWLPLYHDMGLIGSWLFTVYFGAPITILSPISFLSRPERWLWALHDSHGSLCPAPNFAYELCARKIPDEALEGLDLSRWRVAINAGEAVLPETLERFAKRFVRYGFRSESYVPCYGLAESTVALAFPPINRKPVIDIIKREAFESEGRAAPADETDTDVLRFVANGFPLPGHEVKLVDDAGQMVAERARGRLFFRGLSRTSGYYRNPKATAAAITPDGWMDSGDLAYWANGELHITGRLKDIIIKSGRNIVPQEVEAAAADVVGVRRGCVAAFGTVEPDTGTERLVIAAETRATEPDERRRIETEIVKRVDAAIGIPPDRIVLVPPQCIPKTSSGKIRRNETRALLLSGKLENSKRPPWLQVARLMAVNIDSWAKLNLSRASAALYRTWTLVTVALVAVPAGLLARVMPASNGSYQVIHLAARIILTLTGFAPHFRGVLKPGPALLVANRNGRFDALIVAAILETPFSFREDVSLATLPRLVRLLLEPLKVRRLYGEAAPPGGTERQRVRRALEEGKLVLEFSDNPIGLPALMNRFRLDGFHAALETGTPVRPLTVMASSQVLESRAGGSVRTRSHGPEVRIGNPVTAASGSQHQQALDLREHTRQAINALSQ
jgi:acyl carrier protein